MRSGIRVDELEGGYRPPPIPPDYAVQQSAPRIETIESFDGPWNKAGTYGRQQNYVYPASLDADPIAIFSLDRQPGPPRPRTLHLFRSDGTLNTDFPVVDNAEVYARVTYGVSGIQNQFLCDWTRGGQLALVCDSLRLEAVAYRPSTLAIYSPPPGTQLLGAMLGERAAVPILPPTFTTALTLLADNSDMAIIVPDFARHIFVMFTTLPIPSNVVLGFYTVGEQVGIAQFALNAETAAYGVPIPGGTSVVRISNTSGNDVDLITVFQLGL